MTVSPREIGVGIVGFGTVGTGTVKLLLENAELLRKRVGIPIRLVPVRDPDEPDRNPDALAEEYSSRTACGSPGTPMSISS